MPFPILPALAAAAPVIGSLLSGGQSRRNVKDQAKANMELAKYQNEWNLQMWERQNAYNDPAMQRKRMVDAGFNPALMYGTGAANNTAGPAPRSADIQAPDYSQRTPMINDLPTMLSAFQDFQLKKAQTDNVKADTENKAARTVNEAVRKVLLAAQGRKTTSDADIRETQSRYSATNEYHRAQKLKYDVSASAKNLKLLNQKQVLNNLDMMLKEKAGQKMDAETEKRMAEKIFQDYKNQWIKAGITTSDNLVVRMFARMLSETGLMESGMQMLKKYMSGN